MSLIKDFNELNIGTKGTLLNILSTVPFFFIGTYLFNTGLIEKIQDNPLTDIDFYFLLSVCMALSVLWFFMNFIVSTIVIDFVEWIEELRSTDVQDSVDDEQQEELKETQEDNIDESTTGGDDDLKDIFVITYIYSVGYLALAIFLNLWIAFPYKWFILSCFGFIVFRLLWVAIWYGALKRIERKSNG